MKETVSSPFKTALAILTPTSLRVILRFKVAAPATYARVSKLLHRILAARKRFLPFKAMADLSSKTVPEIFAQMFIPIISPSKAAAMAIYALANKLLLRIPILP
jgi:hypothetical protein